MSVTTSTNLVKLISSIKNYAQNVRVIAVAPSEWSTPHVVILQPLIHRGVKMLEYACLVIEVRPQDGCSWLLALVPNEAIVAYTLLVGGFLHGCSADDTSGAAPRGVLCFVRLLVFVGAAAKLFEYNFQHPNRARTTMMCSDTHLTLRARMSLGEASLDEEVSLALGELSTAAGLVLPPSLLRNNFLNLDAAPITLRAVFIVGPFSASATAARAAAACAAAEGLKDM